MQILLSNAVIITNEVHGPGQNFFSFPSLLVGDFLMIIFGPVCALWGKKPIKSWRMQTYFVLYYMSANFCTTQ